VSNFFFMFASHACSLSHILSVSISGTSEAGFERASLCATDPWQHTYTLLLAHKCIVLTSIQRLSGPESGIGMTRPLWAAKSRWMNQQPTIDLWANQLVRLFIPGTKTGKKGSTPHCSRGPPPKKNMFMLQDRKAPPIP
jgi:hypothetical protein